MESSAEIRLILFFKTDARILVTGPSGVSRDRQPAVLPQNTSQIVHTSGTGMRIGKGFSFVNRQNPKEAHAF